jgi:hypothetical protein
MTLTPKLIKKGGILLKKIINELQPWTEFASGLKNINCLSTVEYIIRKIFPKIQVWYQKKPM